ncbi:Hypothetical protein NTJ_01271 [Nesidiocoris tenuis]|uniref:Uncharacterized protein n=1 Tax=Nesidiocoris tenuis TaxID=355587 RepID=A0ABN7A857_9HEMI|nr:Hypothetical protein NTJ_01271 [Nesidiocoris tenuis]
MNERYALTNGICKEISLVRSPPLGRPGFILSYESRPRRKEERGSAGRKQDEDGDNAGGECDYKRAFYSAPVAEGCAFYASSSRAAVSQVGEDIGHVLPRLCLSFAGVWRRCGT